LEAENRQLRMDKEILKKAVGPPFGKLRTGFARELK
jgi:hypothetical protein